MKKIIFLTIAFFKQCFAILASNSGELSLRDLYQAKKTLKDKMSGLWAEKSKADWTKEQRANYEQYAEKCERLEKDIKLRIDYENTFKAEKSSEQKELDGLKKKSSILSIIKRQLMTQYPQIKIDSGPIDELARERSKKFPDTETLGGSPVAMDDFALKKRANVSTADGSAGDLVQETVFPQIVPQLYEKTWSGRIGATFIERARGDFVLPAEDTKPASGFIAEGADYPESSIDFKKAITLKPLKVGALQPFTLQALMQDETMQMQNSINNALLTEWAKKVDDDFLNADANPATEPRGILEIANIQKKDSSSANDSGGDLTFSLIKESETLLEENNQEMPGTWLINAKTAGIARKTLRNNVAGALYIMSGGMFGDMKALVSNLVSSTREKGSSGAVLSDAVLVVPSSVVVVHWAMPTIKVDYSLGFKGDIVWVKVSGYCNIGLKRPKDVVLLENLNN